MQFVDPALQLYAVIIQSFSVNPDSPVLHIIKCIYRWHLDLIIEGKHLLFFQMFHTLAVPLYAMGMGWLVFAMAGLTAAAMSVITSLFSAQTQLFEARDNALLLSMPIPKLLDRRYRKFREMGAIKKRSGG